MHKKFWRAYGLLAGGVIGVGVFGLPAALVHAGLPVFVLHLVVVSGIAWILQFWFLAVVAATPGRHRLPGYARIHLGPWGFRVTAGANVLGLFGALVAYLIAGGTFLHLLLRFVVEVPLLLGILLYLVPGALLLLWGLRALPALELLILGLFLFILTVLPSLAATHVEFSKVPFSFERSGALLPYGVLLFSFWGLSLIPEMAELAGRRKPRSGAAGARDGASTARRVLAASVVTAGVTYLVFAVLVAGITGTATTADALTGLQRTLGDGVVLLALLFGILTTFSSYLALGLTLLRTLSVDFHLPGVAAWALTVFVPLALVVLGVGNLLHVLAFTGAVFLGLEGLAVLAMRWSLARRRPHPRLAPVLVTVAVLLVAGVVSELVRTVVLSSTF